MTKVSTNETSDEVWQLLTDFEHGLDHARTRAERVANRQLFHKELMALIAPDVEIEFVNVLRDLADAVEGFLDAGDRYTRGTR